MKLSKAKELLQMDIDSPGSVPIELLNEAETLGTETMQVLQHGRLIGAHHDPYLLPGETKD